ncbi:MAG TPA: UvrD-helicase domain-containing protein [Kouleothrix sp.]|uniref:ATP-dependent helicase n=1 Tax=Kouleothrix sp. TaxID=2779161 RepID=UPI002CB85CEE|nr:UvrD-helicase domain-containing protein [Kouleothrix sp.]HRC74255.1 UvrD-helicase domain-containing protein [Kouleothrix sp.]
MDILASLNPEQRAAVTAPIGPVLVRAGAGSGKTRVLTLRIAYLIETHQVPPGQILALTFTNKAAKEMRERLRAILGGRTRGLTTGTFHAVCGAILRAEIAGRIGHYTADFTIYAADEQLQLAADALDAAKDRPPALLEPEDLLRQISRAKSRLLSPRMAARFAQTPLDAFVAGCYRRYQQSLARHNALDFDDMILLTHQLFAEHPDVLEAYQAKWRHVLVDEYQDTDPSQYALVELLTRPVAGRPRSLFAVGDGMQAIYGFRNADHTIIARFQNDFPDARVIELATNYRSRQPILDAAYAIIRHSKAVAPMALRSALPDAAAKHAQAASGRASAGAIASPLLIFDAKDGRDEAEQIARSINELARQGRKFREIAILYRTRHLSRGFEAALRHARIPYSVRGSTGFYDRAVVRDALAYLRAIANPSDNLSLVRIANVPARGLGAQALAALSGYASQNGVSLSAALAQPAAWKALSAKAVDGARLLASLLARWRTFAAGTTPPDSLLADVLERSGYVAALEKRFSAEELPDAREHLQELMTAAAEHTDLSAFLQEVALLTSADEKDDERDQVQLLTIHSAKGLEWPIVFVAGLEEGTLPHERSLVSPEGIEEERRLCYVALTRAGERLHLSWSAGRVRGAQAKPSRFLAEIEAYGKERAQR